MLASWRSMTKIAGSGSASRSGSISQRHGSGWIRIYTKMSRIRNTALNPIHCTGLTCARSWSARSCLAACFRSLLSPEIWFSIILATFLASSSDSSIPVWPVEAHCNNLIGHLLLYRSERPFRLYPNSYQISYPKSYHTSLFYIEKCPLIRLGLVSNCTLCPQNLSMYPYVSQDFIQAVKAVRNGKPEFRNQKSEFRNQNLRSHSYLEFYWQQRKNVVLIHAYDNNCLYWMEKKLFYYLFIINYYKHAAAGPDLHYFPDPESNPKLQWRIRKIVRNGQTRPRSLVVPKGADRPPPLYSKRRDGR